MLATLDSEKNSTYSLEYQLVVHAPIQGNEKHEWNFNMLTTPESKGKRTNDLNLNMLTSLESEKSKYPLESQHVDHSRIQGNRKNGKIPTC